jgi:glycosyltransferase involved in cell wall biosynthesis
MRASVDVSLVIPTFNERDSVRPLLDAIESALGGLLTWNALFVDDSNDGTDEVISAIAAEDPRVAVLHRSENRGGLAGAVSDGLRQVASGAYVCVIDSDLQHPPSVIPMLIAQARRTDADVVIASRYIAGGSNGGLDGPMRQFYSRGLKLLAQLLFPRRLAGVTDPLGGFFLVRRSVLQGVHLHPIGYKILLEVLIRCEWRTTAEVPYSFEARRHGESKANLQQGLQFLEHLRTLFWDCSPLLAMPRLASRLSSGGPAAPAPGKTPTVLAAAE